MHLRIYHLKKDAEKCFQEVSSMTYYKYCKLCVYIYMLPQKKVQNREEGGLFGG